MRGTVVNKHGGHAMDKAASSEAFAGDVAQLAGQGARIVVHGRRARIGEPLKRPRSGSRFADGPRVPDEAAMQAEKTALCGTADKGVFRRFSRCPALLSLSGASLLGTSGPRASAWFPTCQERRPGRGQAHPRPGPEADRNAQAGCGGQRRHAPQGRARLHGPASGWGRFLILDGRQPSSLASFLLHKEPQRSICGRREIDAALWERISRILKIESEKGMTDFLTATSHGF
jgi:hypothetical protein